MNLTSLQNTPTMSSREIAELCGKEHRHVLRDIDNLNETYEKMGLPKVGQGYYTTPNTGNQQYREYLLTKEQCIDLITGYRADVRIRTMCEQLNLDVLTFQHIYLDSINK